MTDRNHTAYLLLGSNLGNRKQQLEEAKINLEREGAAINSYSAYYETEPWQAEGQANYLNQALCINTAADPLELLALTQNIEIKQGRTNKKSNQARTLDIDILLYDNEVMESEQLTIPHPRMHLRNFTLIPLMEIAGEVIHPKLHKSIEELYEMCSDPSEVYLLDEE